MPRSNLVIPHLTLDEQQMLLVAEEYIDRQWRMRPYPTRLLDLGLIWTDPTGRDHLTMTGVLAARQARERADADGVPEDAVDTAPDPCTLGGKDGLPHAAHVL